MTEKLDTATTEKKEIEKTSIQKAQEKKKRNQDLLKRIETELPEYNFKTLGDALEFFVNEKIEAKKNSEDSLTLTQINNHPKTIKQTKLIFEQNSILEKQQNMIQILTRANMVAEKTVEILAEKLNMKAKEIEDLVANIEKQKEPVSATEEKTDTPTE